ncbi:hypothetical protein BFW88_10565 [Pseudomonas fluorescens]|nr:hypothetical protein BFW88_10565 [Pseudomonas fluorescens]OPB11687.1 hypothetical protein BFW92_10530 [Pseudomonas fluorescens]OPB22902.1 hypothetical protein BFW93_10560 [Pseudomonas fluorescens]
MKHDPSHPQQDSHEDLGDPNDDGCLVGTAGREEDPNATTDWDHPDDIDTELEIDVKPPNGTPGIDVVPDADNEGAD